MLVTPGLDRVRPILYGGMHEGEPTTFSPFIHMCTCVHTRTRTQTLEEGQSGFEEGSRRGRGRVEEDHQLAPRLIRSMRNDITRIALAATGLNEHSQAFTIA